jgi:hypothetical protein
MVRHMAPMKQNTNQSSMGGLPQPRRVPNHYREILKQFEDKKALIKFRHDLLLRQRNANYTGEYNRIAGHMNSLQPGLHHAADMQRMRNRQNHLQQLAALSLDAAHSEINYMR